MTQNEYHKAKAYVCITMVATARPIHERRQNFPTLIHELQTKNVYLQSTTF